MKIDIENYKEYTDRPLLMKALLDDCNDEALPHPLEIHVQTYHDEYSPERTEPCPDYFGMFGLYWKDGKEPIVNHLTIDELDDYMCTIISAFDKLL